MKAQVASHEMSQHVGFGSIGIGGGPIHIAVSQSGSSEHPGVVGVGVVHSQQSWIGCVVGNDVGWLIGAGVGNLVG